MVNAHPTWGLLLDEVSRSRLGRRAHVTPADVRRRRIQLSAIGFVLLLALVAVTAWLLAAPAASQSWLPSGRVLYLATVVLAAGFAVYVIEKELHLRRLSRMLAEQRSLTRTLAHRVGDLEAVGRMEKAASAARSPGEVLSVVLTAAVKQGKWPSGAILAPVSLEHLKVICASGPGYKVESLVRMGDGPIGRAASTRAPVLAPKDGESSLAVPMLQDGRVIGVIALTASSGRTFAEYDQLVLGLLAECAAPWVGGVVSSVHRAA